MVSQSLSKTWERDYVLPERSIHHNLKYYFTITLLVLWITGDRLSAAIALQVSNRNSGDQLFIYQGYYDSLGTVTEIAELAARHDYVIVTHGFYLDGSHWVNGSCLDVNYSKMPELLSTIRMINPLVKIFAYVPASADHPNGCWPQPSVPMTECPDGDCVDFKTWTDLWLSLEDGEGIIIDGIFIDLVHPALVGSAVRDSIFRFVKSKGKLIMANALSDTIGLSFAIASPILTHEDFVFIEGYYWIAGWPNTQTERMNTILDSSRVRWAAIASEYYNTDLSCNSDNRILAYKMFLEHNGSAFAYQSADVGTQSGRWVYCRNEISTIPGESVYRNVPVEFNLEQNYPNPFNSDTRIRYTILRECVVKISVFNILGQYIGTLVHEFQSAGEKEITFNAGTLPSGLYYYTLDAGGMRRSRMMALLK